MSLCDYAPIVGTEVLDELQSLAARVHGRRLQNINSTAVGGGVAEILTRMVPLLRELGVAVDWSFIKGDRAFFSVTKAFHNALHGRAERLTPEMFEVYRATTEANLREIDFTGDIIFVHDPQPAGLVVRRREIGRRWMWRCHIDISAPDPAVWAFLEPSIAQYDLAVFSMPDFARGLAIPQFMVPPSIDPLSNKNKPLDDHAVAEVLTRYSIDPTRPVLTQISRFDRLKDPLGVIAAYRIVRKRHECQLVLAGGGASDDPEGLDVLRQVREAAADDPDIHVLLLPPFSDVEINALVRGSTIVFQKSIREGFGLTVSEALWKRKPVIGGAVGGIKLQIVDGYTGYLVHSPEGAAERAMRLLGDPDLRRAMGDNGYEHVKQNFLLTRHIKDYLLLMLALDHPDRRIVSL